MHRLKDIARRMDDCHERTAKRWWKKLGIPPDVRGHGPHRWLDATADRLVKLWMDYYSSRGTTPQIVKAKYAGTFTDKRQLTLNFDEKNTVQKISAKAKGKVSLQSARRRTETRPGRAGHDAGRIAGVL